MPAEKEKKKQKKKKKKAKEKISWAHIGFTEENKGKILEKEHKSWMAGQKVGGGVLLIIISLKPSHPFISDTLVTRTHGHTNCAAARGYIHRSICLLTVD